MVYPFDEVLPLYKKVIEEYKTEISQYGYEILIISDTERIYVVQEKFVVYLGMINYDIHLNGDRPTYMIVFEEMMKNTVFKFNFAGFKRKFSTNESLKIEYKKFHGWGKPIREINEITLENYQRFDSTYTASRYLIPSKCDYVNEKFPELNIRELYENLEGDAYYYLILRVIYNNKTGYAIKVSKKKFTDKKILESAYMARYEGLNYSYVLRTMDPKVIGTESDFSRIKYEVADRGFVSPKFEELTCDSRMMDCFYESMWNDGDNAKHNDPNMAFFTIDSYVISKNFKEPEEATKAMNSIFTKTRAGAYDAFFSPQMTFNADGYRARYIIEKLLKSEYKDIEKEYSPQYLRDNGVQYEYDFYIPRLKIAISYRTIINFKAIDVFGGEERHAEVKKNEQIIKELSIKNGIKLVYIDYTDTISLDLLKERINNA